MTDTAVVDPDYVHRRAATLFLIAATLWLHEWFAALLVVGWVAWLILHERLEGHLGETLVRLWRRAWPPSALVLIPLLVANALLYWAYAPNPGKVMPIALNLLALSMIFRVWWVRLARRHPLRRAPVASAGTPAPVARPAAQPLTRS